MFKMMPVLDIQYSNFTGDEREVLTDLYNSFDGSYIQDNIVEMSCSLLDYCEGDKVNIANSIISKIKDALKEHSLDEDRDFVILVWW